MAEAIDELLVRLGLETDAKGFQDANAAFQGIRSTALKLGAALAGGIGFHDVTVGVAKSRDELGKWSKAAGVSAQYVDKLRFAMEQFGGTEMDARGLIDTANSIREAARRGELNQWAFSSTGFNPQQIAQQNMSTEETIDFISKGLSSIKDRDTRARVAGALGINNPFAQNMLADNAGMRAEFENAERLGVVTDEIIENAAAFNAAVTNAEAAMRSLKDVIAAELLPGMSDWINGMAEWVAKNKGDAQTAIDIAKNPGLSLLQFWAKDREEGDGDPGLLKSLTDGYRELSRPGAIEDALIRMVFGLPARVEPSAEAPAGFPYPMRERPEDGKSVSRGRVDRSYRGEGAAQDDAALNSLYDALINQESGGRHSTASGLLRSSKGAQGISQVMPATGQDPGYGVRPLADSSKEEYLRFGRDYLTAMLREFDGDTRKALAAYNAGPGAVKQAVAEHGENWLASMPRETQDYVPAILAQIKQDPEPRVIPQRAFAESSPEPRRAFDKPEPRVIPQRAADIQGTLVAPAYAPAVSAQPPDMASRTQPQQSSTANYYSIDARGSTDPAATEAAVNRAIDRRIANAVQVGRDDFPSNVQ